MNIEAIKSIYFFEMARTRRTLLQSVVSPVISTSLYFIVFGAAIGGRIQQIDGVSYGAFITPGLMMLTLLTQCIGNGSFGIYFPKFTGTIYELLSSPVSMTMPWMLLPMVQKPPEQGMPGICAMAGKRAMETCVTVLMSRAVELE